MRGRETSNKQVRVRRPPLGSRHGKAAEEEGCSLTVFEIRLNRTGPIWVGGEGHRGVGETLDFKHADWRCPKRDFMHGREGGLGGNQEGRWRGWVAFVSSQAALHRQAFTMGSLSEMPSPTLQPSSIIRHLPEALKQHIWECTCLGSRNTSRSGRT